MKRILDSNGRIFGIINVFDFLCLLFLILLLPMIYHGYRLTQVKQGGHQQQPQPASEIPVTKVLLEKDVPVVFEIPNLTYEEFSFIEKRMDQIAWEQDIRFLRVLKKKAAPVMLDTIPLMQMHGFNFLISIQISILRLDFSEPIILFRNASILKQVVKVNVGDRNFKGFLRPLKLNEQNL